MCSPGFTPPREALIAPETAAETAPGQPRGRPVRPQAWREANEILGRALMRDGRWLV